MSTTVTSHLRPGVYSVYEASAVVGRSPRRGWAGVVGLTSQTKNLEEIFLSLTKGDGEVA